MLGEHLRNSVLARRTKPHPSVVDAERFGEREFGAVVRRQTPVLIKGALRHWPASTRWRDLDYVGAHCALHAKTRVTRKPMPSEFEGWADLSTLRAREDEVVEVLPMGDVLDRLRSGETLSTRVHFPPLGPELLADLAAFTFPFSPKPKTFAAATLHYDTAIVYMSQGGSFTDWHYHPGSEALMCQVRGRKQVLLLPPTHDVWRRLASALSTCPHSYDIEPGQFPELEALEPTSVWVEEGDALYIPTWWWHAVEGPRDQLTMTVPYWWPSEARARFNIALPAADYTIWHQLPAVVRDRQSWRDDPRGQMVRAALLAGLFLTPLPWMTALWGGRYGRAPADGAAASIRGRQPTRQSSTSDDL